MRFPEIRAILMNFKIKSFTVALGISSLVGCSAMESEYVQPELAIPQSWSPALLQADGDETANKETHVLRIEEVETWWHLFQDSELNALIDRVLASNSSLEKATLTLRKALLEAGISENNKVPKLGLTHNSSYAYDMDSSSSDSSSSASLSLSYELDLWNRVDALAKASELEAKASYQDRETLAQDLVVTTASLYWKLGYLNQMLAITKNNLRDNERILSLTQLQHDNGYNTELEVLESKQALLNQQLQLTEIQQQISEAQNAISILLNKPLQDTGLTVKQLSNSPIPDIAAGLPSDLLLRRPDIKASLYRLKSALAKKDSVDASYLPTITLTGALNTSSSSLLALLKNPVATLGSEITLPFLEWREMKLNKGISEVDYQMAIVEYRDTIYQAFEEVDNLLTLKNNYHYQNAIYAKQYSNANEIERIYHSQYKYGKNNMVDWLNAMAVKRNAESLLLENQYNLLVVQARLYQSLGGGDSIN